jgi:conjugal transfer pilus assembly protein TraW
MSKRVVLSILMLLLVVTAYAAGAGNTPTSSNADQTLLEDSIRKREEIEAKERQDPLWSEQRNKDVTAPYVDAAKRIDAETRPKLLDSIEAMIGSDENVQQQLQAIDDAAAAEGGEVQQRYRLYVSRAQGAPAIKEIFELAKQHPDMVVVFRGVLPGEEIKDLISFFQSIVEKPSEGDPLPNVAVDPTVFRDFKVTTAPTLAYLDDQGKEIARVGGIVNPTWIAERVARGERGDLGRFGEIVDVAEEDMIVTLQRQMGPIDGEAYAEKARSTYWKRMRYVPLPTARVARTRDFDPTVVINDAITAPDGTVIGYPGQRVNPMDIAPFNMTLVVIDGRDPRQVRFAKRQVMAHEGKPITVITTEIDTSGDGWKAFNDLTVEVGRVVYLLQPEMVERFGLEAVPATVTAGNRVLVVREFGPDELDGEKTDERRDASQG